MLEIGPTRIGKGIEHRRCFDAFRTHKVTGAAWSEHGEDDSQCCSMHIIINLSEAHEEFMQSCNHPDHLHASPPRKLSMTVFSQLDKSQHSYTTGSPSGPAAFISSSINPVSTLLIESWYSAFVG